MSKHYIFYREDILKLLNNNKIFLARKIQDLVKQGIDISEIKQKERLLWDEEFFDEEVERGSIKLEHILDEVDDILKKTHGMTTLERANQIKKEQN